MSDLLCKYVYKLINFKWVITDPDFIHYPQHVMEMRMYGKVAERLPCELLNDDLGNLISPPLPNKQCRMHYTFARSAVNLIP